MSDEVLTSISKPFAAALASLQQGLTNAAKEISTLHENVVSKQTQHQSMLVELAQAKTKLVCHNVVEYFHPFFMSNQFLVMGSNQFIYSYLRMKSA